MSYEDYRRKPLEKGKMSIKKIRFIGILSIIIIIFSIIGGFFLINNRIIQKYSIIEKKNYLLNSIVDDTQPEFHKTEYCNYNKTGSMNFYLYSYSTTINYQFTTILESFKVILTITPLDINRNPYWNETTILSTNLTQGNGSYKCHYYHNNGYNYPWFMISWKNNGINNTLQQGGYFYLDMWLSYQHPMILPTNLTFEWNVYNAEIGNLYGKYHPFYADQYDLFIWAYRATDWLTPIMFMDEQNFIRYIDDGLVYNNRITCEFISMDTVILRPTHNDTWYFVFINGQSEDLFVNVSIRYYQNVFNELPDTDTNPEPDINDPPDANWIGSFNMFIFIGIVSMISIIIIIKKVKFEYNKKEVKK